MIWFMRTYRAKRVDWYDFLRDYRPRFKRQKIISPYIVDFYCAQAQLVVELDGAQHFKPDEIEYDRVRTEYLNELGIDVIRFTNQQVNYDFDNVCRCIDHAVHKNLPATRQKVSPRLSERPNL